jgi:membrane-associated protein
MKHFISKYLIDPLFYIHFDVNGIKLGIYIVLFIVFIETGLFAGFFFTLEMPIFSYQEFYNGVD